MIEPSSGAVGSQRQIGKLAHPVGQRLVVVVHEDAAELDVGQSRADGSQGPSADRRGGAD